MSRSNVRCRLDVRCLAHVRSLFGVCHSISFAPFCVAQSQLKLWWKSLLNFDHFRSYFLTRVEFFIIIQVQICDPREFSNKGFTKVQGQMLIFRIFLISRVRNKYFCSIILNIKNKLGNGAAKAPLKYLLFYWSIFEKKWRMLPPSKIEK